MSAVEQALDDPLLLIEPAERLTVETLRTIGFWYGRTLLSKPLAAQARESSSAFSWVSYR